MIHSCDDTSAKVETAPLASSNKKQKPNSAGGAGRPVLQAKSESNLNIQETQTVTTAKPVTRNRNKKDMKNHSMSNEIDTMAKPVSKNTSGTMARPVTRSMNKGDTKNHSVSNNTADTKGKSVSSFFSLFKKKLEKPQAVIADSDNEWMRLL